MTGPFILRVNGIDLECVVEGEGTPVVFSHGGSSDLRYWEPQRETFAEAYQFVSYSRRFHGSRDWPAVGDYSTDAHVADLLQVIGWLESGPVHLVGFSTSLALRAAVQAPELLATLTSIEPNVPWLLEGDREGESVLARFRSESKRVRSEAAGDRAREARLWFELVANQGPGAFETLPPAIREMWLENFTADRPRAPEPDPLRCEHLGEISMPTLVIGAEFGLTYSRRIVDALCRCIPGATRLVVPGVTHFMSCQEPRSFNDAVLTFLERHPPDL